MGKKVTEVNYEKRLKEITDGFQEYMELSYEELIRKEGALKKRLRDIILETDNKYGGLMLINATAGLSPDEKKDLGNLLFCTTELCIKISSLEQAWFTKKLQEEL